MRKFTKEISALLASAAFGACACAGTVSAASDMPERTAGEMAVSDSCIDDSLPETAGVPMLPDDLTEPEPTEEYPPLAGEPMPPDEMIEETTEELPQIEGGTMPADDWENPEEFPEIEGVMALPDGDVNADGMLSVMDLVMFQKWMLGVEDAPMFYAEAADLNYDGELDVFDLALMKRRLLEQNS